MRHELLIMSKSPIKIFYCASTPIKLFLSINIPRKPLEARDRLRMKDFITGFVWNMEYPTL